MKKETRVDIESLQLIKDAKTFFNTDKILSVDMLDITHAPYSTRIMAQSQKKAVMYNKRLYAPLLLKGSPENLILKLKNGFAHTFLGHTAYLFFDGKLKEHLERKKVYDLSAHYKKKQMIFDFTFDFLIKRYVLPYVDYPSDTPIQFNIDSKDSKVTVTSLTF